MDEHILSIYHYGGIASDSEHHGCEFDFHFGEYMYDFTFPALVRPNICNAKLILPLNSNSVKVFFYNLQIRRRNVEIKM